MINTAAYPKIKTKQKSWEIRIGAFLAKKRKKKSLFLGSKMELSFSFCC